MYSASFGAFASKNRNTFLIQELGKSMKIRRFYENWAYQEGPVKIYAQNCLQAPAE